MMFSSPLSRVALCTVLVLCVAVPTAFGRRHHHHFDYDISAPNSVSMNRADTFFPPSPPPQVDALDLDAYMGRWYQAEANLISTAYAQQFGRCVTAECKTSLCI